MHFQLHIFGYFEFSLEFFLDFSEHETAILILTGTSVRRNRQTNVLITLILHYRSTVRIVLRWTLLQRPLQTPPSWSAEPLITVHSSKLEPVDFTSLAVPTNIFTRCVLEAKLHKSSWKLDQSILRIHTLGSSFPADEPLQRTSHYCGTLTRRAYFK